MYTGYLIDQASVQELKRRFPPKFSSFIGHHITEKFGVGANHPEPKQPDKVEVIGYVADETLGVEGFLVSVDGEVRRSSGGMYHLTWSIDRALGAKPVHTNDIIHNAVDIDPIPINVKAMTFTK